MHLLLICFVAFFIIGGGEKKTAATNNSTMDFEIEITRLIFGRPTTITKVNSETTEVHLYNAGSKNEPEIITRNLELEEIASLYDFLETFPLAQLENSYIYPGVKDGIEMHFSIRIGGIERKIFIGNYFQKNFGKLTLMVSELFEKDYIRYNRDRLPYPKN